jgi:pimeloyl-ACP methyl ester carboxylesterase
VVLRGEESGAGPAVLLVHAGGERRQVWRPVAEVLIASGWRCVAYDQRGHGDSGGSANTLGACGDDVAAMVHAEPPGCVIVGASLGGLAAVAALADPAVRARVAGLVLVDVVPCLNPDRVRGFLSAGGLLGRYSEIVEDILAQVPHLERITAQLAMLDMPVLLVHGDTGSSLIAEDIDRLAALAPHAEVRLVPGAGHLIARDQPTALARVLIEVTAAWR